MTYLNHNKFYKAHTALWEEINEGWVWVSANDKMWAEEVFQGQRLIVRIKNLKSEVYCEALYADDWYFDQWDKAFAEHCKTEVSIAHPKEFRMEDCIYINAWYRQLLRIEEKEPDSKNLTIEFAKSRPEQVWWQFQACLEHPQIVVLLSTVLGIIGVGLGVISLGIGWIAISDWSPNILPVMKCFGVSAMVFGAGVIGYGVIQLFKRATYTPLRRS